MYDLAWNCQFADLGREKLKDSSPSQMRKIENNKWISNTGSLRRFWGQNLLDWSLILSLFSFAGLPSLCPFCTNISLHSANLRDRASTGRGGHGCVSPTSCESASAQWHCFFFFFQFGDEAQHPYFFSLQYVPRLLFLFPWVSEYHQPSRTKPWKLQ